MTNPSLKEENRFQVSTIVAPRKNTSLYDWLEENGRFLHIDESDFDWSDDDEELLAEYAGTGDDSYEPMAA